MQITINLAAGQTVRQETAGVLFGILSITGAASVSVTVWQRGQRIEEIRTAQRGLRARVPTRYDAIELTADTACTVEAVFSEGLVDFDTIQGATVHVINDRGAPGNPFYVSGLTYADAPATSMTNGAAVAVAAAAVQIVAANAARKALRITNLGPDPVAIGAAGITWAARCLVLEVGDTWVEERGNNLAWSAVCDAAKSANVTFNEVIA